MKAYLIGINSKYIHPAMGIFALVSNSKYPVIYDEFNIKDSKEKIIKSILEKEYDILGFSVYIWNSTLVKEIISDLISKGFNKKIFLGGPECYYNAELFLKYYKVNYVIFGEGEEAFNELMDYLDNKISIDKVSNLYYLNNNVLTYTYSKQPNLNNVKHDMSLIKDFEHRVGYIESSRGCPFKCSYCMASLETRVRFFPISQVKEEIKYLLDHKCRTIKFLDRSFNINKDYMIDILNFIKENDNGVSVFQFEIVGDLLSRDVIDYINKNIRKGLLRFEIGVQSTNEKTTCAIDRRQDFKKLKENMDLLKNNVTMHVDLIAGLPYENLESFKNSFNETYLLMGDELQLGFLKELKGTKISNTKEEHDYKFESNPPYEVINNKYISEDELDVIREVEKSLEKFHNKGSFKRTLEYLFIKKKLIPFDTFLLLTRNASKELKYYNDDEAYKYLFDTLKDKVNESELLNYIKLDYLLKNKIKPKIWWEYSLNKEDRNKYFKLFNSKFNIDLQTFYNYSYLDIIDNNILLFIYKDNKVTLLKGN